MRNQPQYPNVPVPRITPHFSRRGKLTIFLGYVPGVGKTNAMLKAGQQRLHQGVDVVCGFVIDSNASENETILRDMEHIPTTYANQITREMDTVAILARRPQLVLIDNLAHINVIGFHHSRRYRDVEDLLENGIDVYTTSDVYRIESLNDVIQQITGVTIQATIPDRLFDSADHIEYIDTLPEELIQRFQLGQIIIPDHESHFIPQIYQLGSLHALRELALRQTAQHVDRQMRTYMKTKAIAGPWPASERLLVCVSSNPFSSRLVRTGCRLAYEFKAEWFTVYVEEQPGKEPSDHHKRQLHETMKLAQTLGAQGHRITGPSRRPEEHPGARCDERLTRSGHW